MLPSLDSSIASLVATQLHAAPAQQQQLNEQGAWPAALLLPDCHAQDRKASYAVHTRATGPYNYESALIALLGSALFANQLSLSKMSQEQDAHESNVVAVPPSLMRSYTNKNIRVNSIEAGHCWA